MPTHPPILFLTFTTSASLYFYSLSPSQLSKPFALYAYPLLNLASFFLCFLLTQSSHLSLKISLWLCLTVSYPTTRFVIMSIFAQLSTLWNPLSSERHTYTQQNLARLIEVDSKLRPAALGCSASSPVRGSIHFLHAKTTDLSSLFTIAHLPFSQYLALLPIFYAGFSSHLPGSFKDYSPFLEHPHFKLHYPTIISLFPSVFSLCHYPFTFLSSRAACWPPSLLVSGQ